MCLDTSTHGPLQTLKMEEQRWTDKMTEEAETVLVCDAQRKEDTSKYIYRCGDSWNCGYN